MTGVRQQRQRSGQQAGGSLGDNEPDVQNRADSEGFPEIGRGVAMSVPMGMTVAVPMTM